MKIVYVTALFLLLIACNSSETNTSISTDSTVVSNTVDPKIDLADKASVDTMKKETRVEPVVEKEPASRTYANERFKDVRVKKVGENKYQVTGKAQVFEAAFSWVVEDGHNELKKGYSMTDAGAPEFGNFNFTVEVAKQRTNSTLHLILFESSAKDGSRQYLLPIPLPNK
ncbi:MAG TPA: Gmad2 immunoglobulin-like domain-containing protein [Flavisolibacter sp.]|nr:Gmad2 immunoglobulin-like domain-containing protein [Flavisolibacter sp.]